MFTATCKSALSRIPYNASSTARRYLSSLSTTCPSCHKTLASRIPSCTHCWYISDIPPSEGHHDVLDMPENPNPFSLDLKLLRRNFLRAQQICHPDMWAAKGEKQRLAAERLSSRVNEAYKTLQEPVPRAHYLLERQNKGIQEAEPRLDDTQILMEIMETMEDIDNSNDPEQLQQIREENAARKSRTVAALENAFGIRDFDNAKSELIQLIYWDRIERSVREKLER